MERGFGAFIHKWNAFILSMPVRLGHLHRREGERVEDLEVVNDPKDTASPRHNSSDAHVNSKRP